MLKTASPNRPCPPGFMVCRGPRRQPLRRAGSGFAPRLAVPATYPHPPRFPDGPIDGGHGARPSSGRKRESFTIDQRRKTRVRVRRQPRAGAAPSLPFSATGATPAIWRADEPADAIAGRPEPGADRPNGKFCEKDDKGSCGFIRFRIDHGHQRGGRLAQLVERLVYTEDVGSSSLSSPTIFPCPYPRALKKASATRWLCFTNFAFGAGTRWSPPPTASPCASRRPQPRSRCRTSVRRIRG